MCISVRMICKSLLISVRNVSFFLQLGTNPARLFLPFYLFTFLPLNVPAGKTEITIFALWDYPKANARKQEKKHRKIIRKWLKDDWEIIGGLLEDYWRIIGEPGKESIPYFSSPLPAIPSQVSPLPLASLNAHSRVVFASVNAPTMGHIVEP